MKSQKYCILKRKGWKDIRRGTRDLHVLNSLCTVSWNVGITILKPPEMMQFWPSFRKCSGGQKVRTLNSLILFHIHFFPMGFTSPALPGLLANHFHAITKAPKTDRHLAYFRKRWGRNMSRLKPWNESSNILANWAWKINFLNSVSLFMLHVYLVAPSCGGKQICHHLTQEFSLDTGCLPHRVGWLPCFVISQRFPYKEMCVGQDWFLAFLSVAPMTWPHQHILLWLVYSCVPSSRIFCMLHRAKAQLFIMHDVLCSVTDGWLLHAKPCARFSIFLPASPLYPIEMFFCSGLSEAKVSCFRVRAKWNRVKYLQIRRLGQMWRSCLEDAIKGIKHMHQKYFFYGRAFVVIDRVPSVEDVIQQELE